MSRLRASWTWTGHFGCGKHRERRAERKRWQGQRLGFCHAAAHVLQTDVPDSGLFFLFGISFNNFRNNITFIFFIIFLNRLVMLNLFQHFFYPLEPYDYF